ncbi:MAG: hypothetical protein GW823_00170 [Bacteroidetes bacterium]|nr:hypothetical protein [Bacteroidota bacterium]
MLTIYTYDLAFVQRMDFTNKLVVHSFMEHLEIPYRDMTLQELRILLAFYALEFQGEPSTSYVIEKLRAYVEQVDKWLKGE